MKKIKIVASLALLCCFVFSAEAQRNRETAVREIAAAENAFADYAAKGTKAAFLRFAAPDGIVFNPAPANAREVWSKKEDRRYLLEWRPHWVDAAATGDIGLSTGSWEFSPKAGDPPVAWGEFFTIWKRQSNGEWLWVLDVGHDHEKAPVPKNAWKSPQFAGKAKNNDSSESWQSLEAKFSQMMNVSGRSTPTATINAYKTIFSDQIRLLRAGHLPFQGKNAVMEFVAKQSATLRMTALGGEVVSDFAYTYGEYESSQPDGKTEKGHFVRAWKQEPKGWRVTADFQLALPQS